MLHRLLGLWSRSADLDLVPQQGGQGRDAAETSRGDRGAARGEVAQLDRRVECTYLADQARSRPGVAAVLLWCWSVRNTSVKPLVSPGTRFDASELNRMRLPPGVVAGKLLALFGCSPPAPTSRCVSPVSRSWTNRSWVPLVSSGTTLVAFDQ